MGDMNPTGITDWSLKWNNLTEELTKLLKKSILINSEILHILIYLREIIGDVRKYFFLS